jgi:hypothetical protein
LGAQRKLRPFFRFESQPTEMKKSAPFEGALSNPGEMSELLLMR